MTSPLWPLAVALATALVAWLVGLRRARATAAVALVGATLLAALLVYGASSGPATFDAPWLVRWGWRLHLVRDALACQYTLLAAGIALPVLAYATSYLPGHLREHDLAPRREGDFFAWMCLFSAAMVGLALSGDLILLFCFFELTTLCSWALVGFDRDARARRGALTTLLVTGVPALASLLGILVLGAHYGTLQLNELAARATADTTTGVAMALIAAGALAKSAQAPLHFWLPRAMAAPTPVSAYLHSATVVAAGVFVLQRLHAVMPDEVAFGLSAVGWLSIAVGGALALVARELKEILAYSTITQYGHAVVMLGIGGDEAVAATSVYVLSHALAKSALFLIAGAVTRATGRTRLDELGGLGRSMPFVGLLAALASAALMGLPLTAGFFKDESFFKVASAQGPLTSLAAAGAVALTVAYTWRFWRGIFLGRSGASWERPSLGLVLPVALLVSALVAGGVSGAAWTAVGRSAMAGDASAFELGYHLDLRAENLLAMTGWLLGVALVVSRRSWEQRLEAAAGWLGARGPVRLSREGMRRVVQLSDWLHRLALRDLRDRIATILLPGAALLALALVVGRRGWRLALGEPLLGDAPLALALLVLGAAAVAVLLVESHLAMVVLLTSVGFVIAVVFALLDAPDVALVAVLIETAMTLLFVVVLSQLPSERLASEEKRARPQHRARWHTVAAVIAAALAGAVSWVALSSPASDTIAGRYVERAPAAHADNVVAAILADFRALDTLAEVSVLLVAMLGIVAVLRAAPHAR